MELIRCPWARAPLDIAYHDEEWGVPCHDDRKLFEMVTLEGAQAGLSWSTILKRRGAYREAFDQFDIDRIAEYDEPRKASLMTNAGVIRNRAKIESTVANARAAQQLRKDFGSLDAFFWSFVDGKPISNGWDDLGQVPASTPLSDKLSRELRSRGFNFVGTTICYALMQAIGLVNDHLRQCYRYKLLTEAS